MLCLSRDRLLPETNNIAAIAQLLGRPSTQRLADRTYPEVVTGKSKRPEEETEPITLAPLDPEDVLRALLKVGPSESKDLDAEVAPTEAASRHPGNRRKDA